MRISIYEIIFVNIVDVFVFGEANSSQDKDDLKRS